MRKVLLLIILILLILAYMGGYWPQHQQFLASQQKINDLSQQLSNTRSAVRVFRLENELLSLLDQTQAQNYGDAQQLSNTFFEDLRHELDRPESAPYRQSLETILQRRDSVTAGLARADATTVGVLRQSLDEIRKLANGLANQVNS